MMEFFFETSPDEDLIGTYKTFADKLLLGKSSKADIILIDKNVFEMHLRFEIDANQLYVTPKSGSKFWINGKKTVNTRKCNIGDKFRIGETKFSLLDFKMSPWNILPEESVKEKFINLSETDKKRQELVELLKRELLVLEFEANHE